ncbi:ATP-binding protein [uncultured Bacteroides sp.]|uniref:ATP-binding protein n=1 Tax=uncultured Bacteroides sp. TaxID=162156 RepID=UPI002AA91ABA|nr:ATP-binding protein [uncultured Bacteroides sp.]
MEFSRDLMKDLVKWKEDIRRKPLILHGARQVGKTWLLKHFGQQFFEDVAYFNFDEQPDLIDLFNIDKDPNRIIKQLSYLYGRSINPQTTLVIFDEIQECKPALNSLKYFCEQTPEYAIVCAGSLLGVSMARGGSFPVGKVNHLNLYPLTFAEFLQATDKSMSDYLNDIDKVAPIPEVFFNRIQEHFNTYMICGGMPSAAYEMVETHDVSRVDTALQEVLNDYRLDFSKHADSRLIPRISHVWDSIPSQLSKENHKFIYQLVRPGARAREYEDAILWLQQAGLIHLTTLNKEPKLPLSAYDDLSIFKIYLSDIGLLRRLAKLSAGSLLSPTSGFTEFKGALAENYILQSLKTQFEVPLRYWTSARSAEVDFILQDKDYILPIEVKSGTNVYGKSLQIYNTNFQPKYRIRYSGLNLSKDDNLLNIPLFMSDYTTKIFKLLECI